MKKKKAGFKSLEEISKIDFNSPKLKKEYQEIERRNKELMESAKVDRSRLHIPFDV